VLDIDIGGTKSGAQFGLLNISGAASLNGTLNLGLINGFVPTLGSSFDIINFARYTGNFAVVNGTGINSTEHFQVVVNPTNVTLDVVSGASATPEPASLLLVGTGLLALGAIWRKRSVN